MSMNLKTIQSIILQNLGAFSMVVSHNSLEQIFSEIFFGISLHLHKVGIIMLLMSLCILVFIKSGVFPFGFQHYQCQIFDMRLKWGQSNLFFELWFEQGPVCLFLIMLMIQTCDFSTDVEKTIYQQSYNMVVEDKLFVLYCMHLTVAFWQFSGIMTQM